MKIFKILASFAVAAGFLWACGNPVEEVVPVIEGEISLTSDTDQLRSDGVDAVTFNVAVTDAQGVVHDVTEHAEIYLNYEKKPLSSNVFSAQKEGEYVFYAVYGLKVSEEVVITAINDVPQLPADPQEDNVSFRYRMLLVQHTGATCSNCPRMMESLKKLSEDAAYNGLYHHVASHSYNGGEADAAGKKSGGIFGSSFASSMAGAVQSASYRAQGILSNIMSTSVEFEAQMDKVRAITNANDAASDHAVLFC